MAASTFEALAGVLRLDTSPWEIGISRARRSIETFRQNTADAFRQIGQASIQLTQGIAAVGTALAAASAGAIKLASDAEEAASKFGFVFKDAADSTRAALDEFSKAAGRSKFELREMAANVGALLGPMGLATDSVGKMSVNFAQLAVDLSSFFNVSEADAMQSLISAVSGSAEPMRKFGVIITEARIQQEAMRLGLAKTKDEISSAAKVQAIYSLVMQDTATAQGDAIRTSDSFSNSMRRLRATLTDVATGIGAELLPVATTMVQRLSETAKGLPPLIKQVKAFAAAHAELLPVAEIWNGLAVAMTRVQTAITNVVSGSGGLVDWAIALSSLSGIGYALSGLAPLIPLVGGLASAIGALINPISLLSLAWTALGGAVSAVMAIFSPVGLVIAGIVAAIASVKLALEESVSSWLAWTGIKNNITELGNTLRDFGERTWSWLVSLFRGSEAPLKHIAVALGGTVLAAVNFLTNGITVLVTVVGELLASLRPVADFLIEGLKPSLDALAYVLEFVSDILNGDFSSAWLKLLKLWRACLETLVGLDEMLFGASQKSIDSLRDINAQIAEIEAARAKQDEVDAKLHEQWKARQKEKVDGLKEELSLTGNASSEPPPIVAPPVAPPQNTYLDFAPQGVAAPTNNTALTDWIGLPADKKTKTGGGGSGSSSGGSKAPGENTLLSALNIRVPDLSPLEIGLQRLKNTAQEVFGQVVSIANAATNVGIVDATKLVDAGAKAIQETAGAAYKQMGEFISLAAEEGASPERLKMLVAMRAQVVESIRAIAGTEGEARDAAIDAAKKSQDSFNKLFHSIKSGTKEFTDLAKSVKKVGDEGEAAARKTRKANDAANQAMRQQAQAVREFMKQQFAEIVQAGQKVATAFVTAFSGIGAGMANFAGFLNQLTDPVEVLTLKIQNLQAQLNTLLFNAQKFGMSDSTRDAIAALQAQIADLQRQLAIAEQEKQEALRRAFREHRAANREPASDTIFFDLEPRGARPSGQVTNHQSFVTNQGDITYAPTIHASERIDARKLVDDLNLELRRRGYDMTGRKPLQRKPR